MITLLTDYGPGSEHVGALHAVLAARAPGIERIDLAHDIPAGAVAWAALLLPRLVGLLRGGVHLAVVDPGVGTERRAIAIRCADERFLVGPDNGLLLSAAERFRAEAVVELTSAEHRAGTVSATFHGRDVFAPAAAHLALGGALDELGPSIAVESLATPHLPRPNVREGRIDAVAIGADRFGNVTLHAGPDDLTAAGFRLEDHVTVLVHDARHRAILVRTFADVSRGLPIVYVDGHGLVALAVNGGSALDRLRIVLGEAVALLR